MFFHSTEKRGRVFQYEMLRVRKDQNDLIFKSRREKFNAGIAYYEQEKYKDALAAFENAVSAGTKETGTICNMMAVCKMQTENYEDAISYYEKALDHSDCSDDMKQEIQFNVIVCYEKLEDWDNAKAKLEDYVTAYPDDEKAAKEAEFLKTR